MRYPNSNKNESFASEEPASADPGEIFNEINRLGISLSMLTELLATLHKRLSPVMSVVVTDSGGEKEECSTRTDIGQQIRQHDYTARAAVSNLRDILSGLELP